MFGADCSSRRELSNGLMKCTCFADGFPAAAPRVYPFDERSICLLPFRRKSPKTVGIRSGHVRVSSVTKASLSYECFWRSEAFCAEISRARTSRREGIPKVTCRHCIRPAFFEYFSDINKYVSRMLYVCFVEVIRCCTNFNLKLA